MGAGDLLRRLTALQRQVDHLASQVVHARASVRGRTFPEFVRALALLQAAERVFLVDAPGMPPAWRGAQRRHEVATASAMAQLEELDPDSVDFLVDFTLFTEDLGAHGQDLRERLAQVTTEPPGPIPDLVDAVKPVVERGTGEPEPRPFTQVRSEALVALRALAPLAGTGLDTPRG